MDQAPLLFCEPVVNAQREPVGYDLTLLTEQGERAPGGGVAALLHGAKQEKDFFNAVSGRFAAAHCGQVEADRPDAPPGRFVLSLTPDEGINNVAAMMAKWKAAGFAVCADVPDAASWPQQALSQANYLRFDCSDLQRAQDARKGVGNLEAKQVARAVRSPATFEQARAIGFNLFQGHFFTTPNGTPGKTASASYGSIVTLMKLAQQDAPVAKVEEVLKRDATLSYRLLRYINSAGFGLSCELQSFKQAVTVLGYQNLYKWLALLMVTAARQNTSAALVSTAVMRGRVAELLGADLFDQESRDNLFIVGAFSLLHVILQKPLQAIVEQIALGDTVTEALYHRTGPFGPLLELVELTEQLDIPGKAERVAELAMSLGLTHQALNRTLIEALIWSEGIGGQA